MAHEQAALSHVSRLKSIPLGQGCGISPGASLQKSQEDMLQTALLGDVGLKDQSKLYGILYLRQVSFGNITARSLSIFLSAGAVCAGKPSEIKISI